MSRAGIFASAHVPAGGSYRAEVLADSPFCYFPLDDVSTPTDVMGNATVSSVAGVTFGAAGIGDGATAASFDGGATNRGIQIAGLPSGIATAVTVEMIAKATNMTTQRALFTRDNEILLRHRNDEKMYAATGSPWANQIDTDYPVAAPTAAHHWAVVYDGTTSYLYMDGVAVASEAQTMSTGLGSATHIGSRNKTDATFLGTLAGFAYYRTALSGARILAHAQAAGVA